MNEVLSEITTSDWIQLAGVIAATLVPLLVLVVTIYVQHRHHKQTLDQHKNQFEEQLKTTRDNYKIQIEQQGKSVRATHMPFLHLDDAVFSMRDKKLVIRPQFTNLGNGTAFKVMVLCEDDSPFKMLKVCDAFIRSKKVSCRYIAPFSDNVIAVNGKSSFELIVDYELDCGGQEEIPGDVYGQFSFKVNFIDALHDQYTQEFFFQFWGDSVVREESFMPELNG